VLQLLQINGSSAENSLTPLETLGKQLFFDTNLSTPPGQSCAACHAPETGFVGPDSEINAHGGVYEGAVADRFSARHPPTAAYAGDSPVLHYDETKGLWVGGMFLNGRATGWALGDPLAEQAQAPFLNPVEQNNPNPQDVVQKVNVSDYIDLFKEVWGEGSLDNVEEAYDKIGMSIAAYERSSEVNPFSSKYDAYLAGNAELTQSETFGLELFQGKALCSSCHVSETGSSGELPVFTDFTYWNLGIPKNPENPFYNMPSEFNPDGENFIDYGLGAFLKNVSVIFPDKSYPPEVYEPELGKFKTPTLRNVDLRPYPEFVKSYGHNGFFKSLEGIVHFYNTRDVEDWPEPEVSANKDLMFMGNLGLTSDEETAIVSFLKTLSDGYTTEPTTSIVVVLVCIFVVIIACLVAFALIKKHKSAR
jgi:cytochrome c peroxidase